MEVDDSDCCVVSGVCPAYFWQENSPIVRVSAVAVWRNTLDRPVAYISHTSLLLVFGSVRSVSFCCRSGCAT